MHDVMTAPTPSGVRAGFYRVCALLSCAPVYESRGLVTHLVTLPLDFSADGTPCEVSRYLSLVAVPRSCPTDYLMDVYSDARPYSYQYLTYVGGGCLG